MKYMPVAIFLACLKQKKKSSFMDGHQLKYCLCGIRIKIFLRLLSRIIYGEFIDRLDLSQKSVIIF